MTTVLLDSHVAHWWPAEPGRSGPAASREIEGADGLAVSSGSWFELAWLARPERITRSVARPVLAGRAGRGPADGRHHAAIADAAAARSASFPGDPADRLIYATAIEHGRRLITKDRRLLAHHHPRRVTV